MYTVVYDIRSEWWSTPMLVLGGLILLMSVVACCAICVLIRSLWTRCSVRAWTCAAVASVAALIGAVASEVFHPLLLERRMAVIALSTGRAQIAEGVVQVLRQQPASGHAGGDELIVGTARVTVDAFAGRPAYSQTIAYHGALVSGARVRIYHSGADVLRIEVEEATHGR